MIFRLKNFLFLVPLFFLFSCISTINCMGETAEKIIFEFNENYRPYQFYKNGDLTGFEIELTDIIFKNSNYDVLYKNNVTDNKSTYLSYQNIEYSDTNDYSKSNIVYYKRYVFFTLCENNYVNFTFEKAKNINFGVLKDSFPYYKSIELGLEPIIYNSDITGIDDLNKGKIDAWFGDVISAEDIFIRKNLKSKISFHNELSYTEPVYIVFSQNNAELLGFVNKRLDEIKSSGEFEDCYMSYFFNHSKEYQDSEKNEYIIKIIIVMLFTFVIICLLVYKRLKKIFAKSRFSKTITKSILNHGNRFIILWKSDFSYYEVNSYFKNTFGLEKEIMPKGLSDCIGDDFLQKLKTNGLENILNSDSILTKSYDACKEIREIMWTSILITNNGQVKTILSIGSDMTEKNRLKRELRLSDQRYQIALESADIAMIFIDNSGNVSYLSDVGYRLMGLDNSDSLGIQNLLNRIHPSDREIYASNILGCANNKQFSMCEVRVLGRSGEFRWFAFKFKLINNPTTGSPCMAGAFYDINDDKEKDLRIEKLAFEDDLTGIYNRKKFLSIVRETLINADIDNIRYAVLTFNLDKFHRFNDLYGVEAGDGILKRVANIIKYNPYGKDCTCARLGNDEFACLIRLDYKEEHLEKYVNEISARIQKFTAENYDEMKLTISAGVCIYPDNVSNYNEVYERSIFSMRIAKNNSNITYQLYDSSIKEIILKREIIEKELLEAVEKKQFELYYQPKVDIFTEKIVGAEALIRWNHPTRGVVSPTEFIPIAEEIGVISEIGKWTLETACKQNRIWQESGYENIKVSVNITSIEFYQTDIVTIVKSALEKAELDPQWLEIELTESMALFDVEETIFKMNALKEIGVGISMDDFGTGYSSLSYIQNLPIDELKLDKSFINKITRDETTKNIISAIINLAKIIGLVVVAEGVEEREQFNLLKEMNCNIIQGYLFAKPLKKDEFIKMM